MNSRERRVTRWQSELCALIAIVFVTGFQVARAHGQSNVATEYQVKAAFLYNFAKFVEWPAEAFSSPDAAMQICILGENPFGDDLESVIREKRVGGHTVRVVQVRRIREIRACHILFVALSEAPQLSQILAELSGSSVLTVSDLGGFTAQGGMIGFIVENERVRFEVSAKAASSARLRISSKLLSVAKRVIE